LLYYLGTGFSDKQRLNPPKIGSIITFKYQELSEAGKPRFPAFLRERSDLTWDEVCENAKTKVGFLEVKMTHIFSDTIFSIKKENEHIRESTFRYVL
jgi:hypothetical protein